MLLVWFIPVPMLRQIRIFEFSLFFISVNNSSDLQTYASETTVILKIFPKTLALNVVIKNVWYPIATSAAGFKL